MLVVPSDWKWPEQSQEERKRILQARGEMIVGIAHFGSTAIPGLRLQASLEDHV
jgi:GrpB-like predicted nucleotidyltransferase (UPF0157 family)